MLSWRLSNETDNVVLVPREQIYNWSREPKKLQLFYCILSLIHLFMETGNRAKLPFIRSPNAISYIQLMTYIWVNIYFNPLDQKTSTGSLR